MVASGQVLTACWVRHRRAWEVYPEGVTTPDFVLDLRAHVGHGLLWLPGVTALVLRTRSGGEQDVQMELGSGPIDPTTVEVLVVRRADNGDWTPVTGIIDPGEEAADAGVREILEEAGVHARPLRLLSTEVVGPLTYANGDRAVYLDLAFLYEWLDGEPWPADGENSETCFVPADEVPEMNPRFMRILARALSGGPEAAFAAPRQS